MNCCSEDDEKLQADVTKAPEVPISGGCSSVVNVCNEALIFRVPF